MSVFRYNSGFLAWRNGKTARVSKPPNSRLGTLRLNKTVVFGGCILLFFICLAIFSGWIAPYDPAVQAITQRLKPPSAQHLFGTDFYGRDIFSRVIYGSRVSLMAGVLAVAAGGTAGTVMGLLSGFFGGLADSVIMRFVDTLMSLPTIMLALVIVAIFGAGGVASVVVAVGMANAPRFARIVRGEVLTLKTIDYVAASRALGASWLRMMFYHILPNTLPTVLVLASLRIGEAVLTEASLSFLGYGPQSPSITWGSMIAEGRNLLRLSPWVPLIPAGAIVILVVGFNLLGEGLVAFLDPRRPILPQGGRSIVMTSRVPMLTVTNLEVVFSTTDGERKVLDGVSFEISPGETVALVGESGSGKSVTARALFRLIEEPGRIVGGKITFDGSDVLSLDKRSLRELRGNRIAMVFQEPMTSLNPILTIGDQLGETIAAHLGTRGEELRSKALQMLEKVRIRDPRRWINSYPHELSGGMRQRIMIAIALCCSPSLLVADEPTTALDMTVQAQILSLMDELKGRTGMAMLLITHDLGIVAERADRVLVMYAGRIVEESPTRGLFQHPHHPYTAGLIACLPRIGSTELLQSIPGSLPSPIALPTGCRFRDRCPQAADICAQAAPPLTEREPGRRVACHFA